MNNKKRLVIALVAVIGIVGGTAFGMYRFGMHRGMAMSGTSMPAAGQTAVNAGATDKKPLYWHDPMVPGQKFDKPGKSPFMDMMLVPVYGGDEGDDGKVVISPRMQQNLGVRTAEVVRENISAAFDTVGSIGYNERDVAVVQARSNGFVERLYVRAVLDPVKKGQALADLYVPDWVAAQEEFLTARRLQGSGIDGLADAARQRMRLAGMSEAQIRSVELTGKLQTRVTLTAPIAGIVSELSAREGMTVMSGAPLFKLNGLATVWANAEVPENNAAQVRNGAQVEARAAALPGTVFKGRVSAILPEVNAATRTLKARIELTNPRGELVPGMFATLRFAAPTATEKLTIPSEAVIQTGTRSVVMVEQAVGKFAPVDVVIGSEMNGRSEVRKGLEAGQKVVVSGQFLIDSEASLKGSQTRMTDPAGATSGGAAATSSTAKTADPTHRAVGKIEKIEADEVTISHGPVASLQWGPMTMGFKSPKTGLPKNVAIGDTVNFDITVLKDGQFGIATITPVAPAAPAAPAAPIAPSSPAAAKP